MEDRCVYDFSGKVVLVSGASGNLGQAVARAFHAAGANLVLLDRVPGRLQGLYPELAESSDYLLLGSVDATDAGSVDQAVQTAVAHFGHLDVLANTIGGYRAGTAVHETTFETWDLLQNLNLRPAFVLSRAVVPTMLEQGSGKIVHTAARAALKGGAKSAAYSVSKSGVVRLVESLAAELRQKGINANCVLPGTIDTPQNRESMPNANHSRWVSPQAIADVFLFLASDASRAVNGAAIPAYGQS